MSMVETGPKIAHNYIIAEVTFRDWLIVLCCSAQNFTYYAQQYAHVKDLYVCLKI